MWSEWSTAQIALVISGLSFALALAGFIWNVWAKFIFPKPKLKVHLAVSYADLQTNHIVSELGDGQLPGGWLPQHLVHPSIRISGTNFGPGKIILQCAIARKSWFEARGHRSVGMLNPYNNYPFDLESKGPFSGGLPKSLDVGEDFWAYFPVEEEWITQHKLAKFGFLDSLGRQHYCVTRDVRNLRKSVFRMTRTSQ